MKRVRLQRRRTPATIGLVVEGDTEFEALPAIRRMLPNCPPLRAVNLGGVGQHLTPLGIAKMVAPKIVAHWAANRRKVIVCIDREGRDQCVGGFAGNVRDALHSVFATRANQGEYHVVLADRAFEAWILADARGLYDAGAFVTAPNFCSFEGKDGERNQKGVLELSRLLGREYDKRRDGPKLFEKVRLAEARKYSAGAYGSKSLDKLLRTIGV